VGENDRRERLQAAARVVKPLVVRAWRAALRWRAVDETDGAAGRACLVLAPHPDDETLGAGALIARKRAAGTAVRVVFVTDGRGSHTSRLLDPDAIAAIRRAESFQACDRLGVPRTDVVHLDIHEGAVVARADEILARVVAEIERMRPDDLLVTSGMDWHVDHRALADVARAAVSAVPGTRLLEYPVWCWADGPWSNRPGRTALQAARDLVAEPLSALRSAQPVTVQAGADHLARKQAALDAYTSQTTNLTGELDWAVMDRAFLAQFLGPDELFLAVAAGQPAPSPAMLT
jgi:LmbE family N-acetylglucosaminyl deacetylase